LLKVSDQCFLKFIPSKFSTLITFLAEMQFVRVCSLYDCTKEPAV